MATRLISVLFALSTIAHAEGPAPVFADDFDRPDAKELGNGWSSKGAVSLEDNAIHFQAKEEEFRPRTRRTFPARENGKFAVSFRMDWLRTSEGTWAFYMQLGNSATMPKRLVYLEDLAKGIGVNLVWGGGELVDHKDRGSLGHLKDGKFTPLVVANNADAKGSVVDDPILTIDVDLDASTFTVHFGGKTYPDLPLATDGPMDTIRFITNGCSASGFSKSSIDDVVVTAND